MRQFAFVILLLALSVPCSWSQDEDSSTPDAEAPGTNINERYAVAAVELEGVSRSLISDALYDEMQRMVGQRLDHRQAELLRQRIESELGVRYTVVRKVRRSTTPRQLQITYEVSRNPLLPFRNPRTFAAYHSKEGFSFAFDVAPHLDHQRTQKLFVGAANGGDSLSERFAGFRIGYEDVKLATDRLGLRFDYATYHTQWNVHTFNAAQESVSGPGLYRRRRSLEASLAFAIDAYFYVTTGITANELEMQSPTVHFEPVRAGKASLRYRRVFGDGDDKQGLAGGYEVRTGTRALDSNFVYTRHSWDAEYMFRHEKHVIATTFVAGRITGNAPLFERFSLGDVETLRGWNKYEIAPLGGSREAYGSLEYHFDHLLAFYDVGSIWDPGVSVKIKPSIGLGVGSTVKGTWDTGKEQSPFTLGDFSLILAVPFAEGKLQPTVMVMARFHM